MDRVTRRQSESRVSPAHETRLVEDDGGISNISRTAMVVGVKEDIKGMGSKKWDKRNMKKAESVA